MSKSIHIASATPPIVSRGVQGLALPICYLITKVCLGPTPSSTLERCRGTVTSKALDTGGTETAGRSRAVAIKRRSGVEVGGRVIRPGVVSDRGTVEVQTSPLSIVSNSTPLISTRRQGANTRHQRSGEGDESASAEYKRKPSQSLPASSNHLPLTGRSRVKIPSPWISGLSSRFPTQMSPPTRLPTSPHEPEPRPFLRLPIRRQYEQPLTPQRGHQQQLHWHQLRPSQVVRSQSPEWLPRQEEREGGIWERT